MEFLPILKTDYSDWFQSSGVGQVYRLASNFPVSDFLIVHAVWELIVQSFLS